ncbi:RagB/SusD family nutrient uptake outer membrane protein [Pedobacter africanus]|uniref:SusD family protein n=1 Tax=Pedobacter africanus TaxID=151894 RepID=A0A1W2A1W0_9SPHI|nr:RagB/SusD family nutrient uptake outer membrane protein [Pedobacter africanus]SMC54709.1 SusD family protein [Pedobacter africanus]
MKIQIKYLTAILIIVGSCEISCKKFLQKKSEQSQFVPNTIADLKALLDSYTIMNTSGPGLLEMLSDNYYITDATFQTTLNSSPDIALNYNWVKEAVPYNNSWNTVYQNPIYYSNIVLDHLPDVQLKAGDEAQSKILKGSALFYRAFAFYEVAQLYCKPFGINSSTDAGIVLRMTSDINSKSSRANVAQTYEQIISDLKVASDLLPSNTTFPSTPSKIAAYGALARVYLVMRDYESAGMYSNLCLQQKGTLIDFNDLIPLKSPPITIFNSEVLFHNVTGTPTVLQSRNARVDSNLYKTYDANDLRKTVFFKENTGINRGTYFFQGSYNGDRGQSTIFNGLTTSEMYLIRAECHARKGNVELALADLNVLLKKRWNKNVPYTEITASNVNEALNKILEERRKELVFRGLRWSDLQRFNSEGANITLKRVIGGTTYTLPPDDPRWQMLIPYDVINRAGIAQNPR